MRDHGGLHWLSGSLIFLSLLNASSLALLHPSFVGQVLVGSSGVGVGAEANWISFLCPKPNTVFPLVAQTCSPSSIYPSVNATIEVPNRNSRKQARSLQPAMLLPAYVAYLLLSVHSRFLNANLQHFSTKMFFQTATSLQSLKLFYEINSSFEVKGEKRGEFSGEGDIGICGQSRRHPEQ